jgi:hypothetical protein
MWSKLRVLHSSAIAKTFEVHYRNLRAQCRVQIGQRAGRSRKGAGRDDKYACSVKRLGVHCAGGGEGTPYEISQLLNVSPYH